ncbi:hypothetical protein ACFROC_04370 [Nocardia tengchongensis]|uniref:hypothetical protein n=1 Tax=Nocardia tengchongensis TaxID=2055889 RepID=UPI0036892F0D
MSKVVSGADRVRVNNVDKVRAFSMVGRIRYRWLVWSLATVTTVSWVFASANYPFELRDPDEFPITLFGHVPSALILIVLGTVVLLNARKWKALILGSSLLGGMCLSWASVAVSRSYTCCYTVTTTVRGYPSPFLRITRGSEDPHSVSHFLLESAVFDALVWAYLLIVFAYGILLVCAWTSRLAASSARRDNPENSTARYEPSSAAHALFYTDFEGNPAEPGDVLNWALEGGWAEREPGVLALYNDDAAHPAERLLACAALARWGSADGYRAVIEGAMNPDRAVWIGGSADRWGGADNSFAILAEDVAASDEMAETRGTLPLRAEALTQLLRISDRFQFERSLSQGLSKSDMIALRPEIELAIRNGIERLLGESAASFDLHGQIAGLIRSLARVDRDRAIHFSREFLKTSPNRWSIVELGDLIE